MLEAEGEGGDVDGPSLFANISGMSLVSDPPTEIVTPWTARAKKVCNMSSAPRICSNLVGHTRGAL